MSAGYASIVRDFLETREDGIVGSLVRRVAESGIETQRRLQIKAWEDEISLLKRHLSNIVSIKSDVGNWHIVLEYELPRRQKRPDVVFLAQDTILVLEFKFGAIQHDAAARWQVEEYAFDLRDFHAESTNRNIVPVLCATNANSFPSDSAVVFSNHIANVQLTNAETLGSCLLKSYSSAHRPELPPISPQKWLNSAYRPTLTIIEAAERLYENHDVREISHNYADNLGKTTDMLKAAIEDSRTSGKHVICFVTGIPGAGKTLTGLNLVHDPSIRSEQGPSGIFLSGNGPLVKIVREALIRQRIKKGQRRKDVERKVSTFIQNVHTFLRYHSENQNTLPHEHIVVFDEAQRAWNRKHMKRKRGIDISEPSQLLEVMERLNDWAVVVALVGGGQEIFLGEAGLEEWGNALLAAKKRWTVVASPEVVAGGASVAGHRLLEGEIPPWMDFRAEPLAHLNVSVRSHRAQLIAEWVNDLLLPEAKKAFSIYPGGREFPIALTRSLDNARQWLRNRSQGDPFKRCGLVSTSEDQRLRAYGLENSSAFRADYPFDKWFLEGVEDVRSSFALEVSATEFECQGLELDWVGVCWGGDLVPSENYDGWEYRKFRGCKWQICRSEEERAYIRNRYRVLLTRARQGMIVWVPEGDRSDPTRDPERFDRVCRLLREAGIPFIDSDEGRF